MFSENGQILPRNIVLAVDFYEVRCALYVVRVCFDYVEHTNWTKQKKLKKLFYFYYFILFLLHHNNHNYLLLEMLVFGIY